MKQSKLEFEHAICLGKAICLAASAAMAFAASGGLQSTHAATIGGEARPVDRTHRWVVTVPPRDIGDRERDAAPARIEIDAMARYGRPIDVASIVVVRVDPATGEPLPGDDPRYIDDPALQPIARSFRWLDADIPVDFPEVHSAMSRTGNAPRVRPMANAGYAYAPTGSWERGRLVFMHTQDGRGPSHYAIHFDLLEPDASPAAPPRYWMGDGLPRCAPGPSSSTFTTSHVRMDLDDFDGDGDLDIVAGEQYGLLMWLPNTGSPQQASFDHLRLLRDEDGRPIDLGIHAAPHVVDWDGDGLKDLLVGTYVNRVAFLKNVGANDAPRFRFVDVLRLNGKPLALPMRPVIGRDASAFRDDYYPVPATVDVNGDGRLDLLLGGYLTGRVFAYHQTRRGDDGLPVLEDAGSLEADGHPINVGDWCAAPGLIDLNGDGPPELISGAMPMTAASREGFTTLQLYRNIGEAGAWRFTADALPTTGPLPDAGLATPRGGDLNGDGLPDIAFSGGNSIYLAMNVGSQGAARFEPPDGPLQLAWGPAAIPATYALDYNRDGLTDFMVGYSVYRNTGAGNPFSFDREPAIRNQPEIRHDSGRGDDWFWPRLADFDGDGAYDVLFGDWWGHVRFHRRGDGGRYDPDGLLLAEATGEPIRVGPASHPDAPAFEKLQGARTVFHPADFDGDGRMDLAVGDTFGDIHLAHRLPQDRTPNERYVSDAGDVDSELLIAFASFEKLGSLGRRLMLDATDIDGDGKLDLIAGSANGKTQWLRNRSTPGRIAFDPPVDLGMPPIRQPRLLTIDLNRDGDVDFFSPSTVGSVWVERSFVEHGYAEAELRRIQRLKK